MAYVWGSAAPGVMVARQVQTGNMNQPKITEAKEFEIDPTGGPKTQQEEEAKKASETSQPTENFRTLNRTIDSVTEFNGSAAKAWNSFVTTQQQQFPYKQ